MYVGDSTVKFFHKQKFIDLKALLLVLPLIGSLHAEQSSAEQAEVGELSISLAVGYGEKSNPLHKGDAFPLLLVPAVHYYGKNWYFDNGDLAYTLAENSQYSVNLVTSFNGEAAHFHDWHPANILVSSQFVQVTEPELGPEFDYTNSPKEDMQDPIIGAPGVSPDVDDGQSPTEGNEQPNTGDESPVSGDIDTPVVNEPKFVEKIVYDQVAKRKWNLDAGVQFHWFIDGQQQVKVRWLHDVMSVHSGNNLKLEYSHKWRFNKWQHKVKLGVDWLSSDLANYYYGISQVDTQVQSLWYQPGSALLPYVGYASSYQLNDKWAWVMSAHYQQLASKIQGSPIVDKNYRYTVFTGIRYAF